MDGQIDNSVETALPPRALAVQLIRAWPPGEPFDAQSALDAHPELRGHKSALIELAYEEFCRRDEQGLAVDPAEFAAGFPMISGSLLDQIEVHRVFVQGTADWDWPVPGQAWLDFELLDEIGRGAFSRVYLARERSLGDRPVVVKATPFDGREAQTLGRLQHLHVVPVHSVKRDDRLQLTAVCMPFLSRVSLF